jgi:hypothetical protein
MTCGRTVFVCGSACGGGMLNSLFIIFVPKLLLRYIPASPSRPYDPTSIAANFKSASTIASNRIKFLVIEVQGTTVFG